MIGNRLKVARTAAGLSLRDLAGQIQGLVTPQAIGKYERNEDMPSSGVLIALAAALRVSEEYLLNEDELSLEGVEFRKKALAREEAAIEAQTLQHLERYLAIENMLQLRSVCWSKPRNAPWPVHELHDAEDAARSVREEWGLGSDPIPRLAELLEERGVKVLSLALEDVDGLAAKVNRRGHEAARVIVIKKSSWSERKRFNLAHELGHMVIDPLKAFDNEKDAHKFSENAAHRFASAFLMPADALRAEVGAHRSSISIAELVSLKIRFGASIQAISYRCKDLGIIDKSTYQSLFRTFTARKWRQAPFEEPATMRPEDEEPRRFDRLCYRALAENVIGEARAAELLNISVRQLNERLDQGVDA